MRPTQWVKNSFVLAPLLFSGEFTNFKSLKIELVAAFLFSLASSASYVLNDIFDIEHDKLHPVKSKSRPLSSGACSIREAIGLLIVLYAILVVAWFFYPKVIEVISAYLVLNIAYTLVLKHVPVVDIFSIAIGFVLRVLAGTVALGLDMSSWLFVTALSIALYLGAIKRRQELRRSGHSGRAVLKKYSPALVNQYAEMSATATLIFYSLFATMNKPKLVVTIPLVLFGLFRYWYVVDQLEGGESPSDVLLKDWQVTLTVLAWAVACAWALWPTA